MVELVLKHKKKAWACLFFVIIFSFFFVLPKVFSVRYLSPQYASLFNKADKKVQEEVYIPAYVHTPDSVRGIYMTSWIASGRDLRNGLVRLIDETELNTVVIDVKDYSGKIVFKIDDNPRLKSFGSEEIRVKDMREFIDLLHKKNIYVVARIAVFQDEYFVKYRPDLAVKNKAGNMVWKDRKGISWIDPGSREYWDYIVLIARESRKIGFDEINFDYIRFPSDGNMQDISFPFSSTTPKHLVMKSFFEYLHNELRDAKVPEGESTKEPTLKISADLFGMVTTATDDMGIGQLLEDAFPYFDYIMPMVYPSHYPPTFEGFSDPEKFPYEIIKISMQSAIDRANLASTTPSKLRPWLQDFGLRVTYGREEVRAQIKAVNDIGLSSWVLWSPSNKYTKSALNLE